MKKELYFDISNENAGGSLYRVQKDDGLVVFYYQHSTYDDVRDEVKVFEDHYPDFNSWWQKITQDKQWYYQHPLFVHPDIRPFVKEQLQGVNWAVSSNKKWQESHQRQWKKVLEGGGSYYRG
ncbi:MAG: hypothetical protein JST39_01040 [Bacteroidetes bacterium]|nr:hypothetical protein [Bacteroidota bacterium]